MIILEIRNTIMPSVIMNNAILKPPYHTLGDKAPAAFTSLRAVMILHVHGMKENASAIDPNGLTHLGAFQPQNSIATSRMMNTLRIHGGTICNKTVIGLGINTFSTTSSINSSSIKHLYFCLMQRYDI